MGTTLYSSKSYQNRDRKELWELVMLICDWFILILSQRLVPRTVHTQRPALRLDFLVKVGSSHKGTWSSGLVAGTISSVCADL